MTWVLAHVSTNFKPSSGKTSTIEAFRKQPRWLQLMWNFQLKYYFQQSFADILMLHHYSSSLHTLVCFCHLSVTFVHHSALHYVSLLWLGVGLSNFIQRHFGPLPLIMHLGNWQLNVSFQTNSNLRFGGPMSGHVICELWMSAWNFVLICLLNLEIFHWMSKNFDVLVALDEKSGDKCNY